MLPCHMPGQHDGGGGPGHGHGALDAKAALRAGFSDVAMDMQAMIGALSALATAQTAAQLRQALSASAPLQQHSPIAEARQSA